MPDAAGEAPTTGDPVDMAMAAEASGRAPPGAALRVLQAQEALLREQTGLARNERFRNRIKAVRDLSIAAAVLLLLLAAGSMVWSARRADEVVLQAFAVPPAMAAEGLTGDAVAGELLDRMGAIQTAAETWTIFSQAEARGEGETVRLEIPQTASPWARSSATCASVWDNRRSSPARSEGGGIACC